MSEDEQRFVAMWTEYGPRVMAYALRHLDSDAAQDVVSETFLVAWRRLASVPDEPLPWLLVVARNTIGNLRRSGHRQARLAKELERFRQVAEPAAAADVLATERAAVLARLAALTPREREALLLVAWDGLTPGQAAKVAGCSLPAFHVRLFRARRRLQADCEADTPPYTDTTPRPLPFSGGGTA
ncbi:RNA polymerase sigma factor [Micromonospora sp. WMMD1102]|uniref:RNA polymerase sigma factor n=1 Tax=Micromonospora sp. WMMD1102 TaxID=3016105 RepID=UPI00241551EC|nr:RNA polymerase sigma factor [Micromonospora sp. WMMD1102]MDG4785399.1 RNA polymerase sigma factor [Micromonospora sp. WMMD1102]